MKKTELNEMRKMDTKDLNARVEKMRKELQDLLIDRNSGKVSDLKAVSKKRHDIAQVLTVARQKEILAAVEGAK